MSANNMDDGGVIEWREGQPRDPDAKTPKEVPEETREAARAWEEGLPSYADAKTPEEIREVAQAWDERAEEVRRHYSVRDTGTPVPRNVVHRAKLPYPWPEGEEPLVTVGQPGAFELRRMPGALAVGQMMVTRSASDVPQEGILAFYQDRIGLFLNDGRKWSTSYEGLASFKLKRSFFPRVGVPLKRLTLVGTDGAMLLLRIGPELYANAVYILNEKRVPSG